LYDFLIWYYVGGILTIFGSIATVIGPGVKDPIVRTLNTEIAGTGVALIFLSYNHTLAILTFIASTTIVTMILLRAIVRLEEMGAEV